MVVEASSKLDRPCRMLGTFWNGLNWRHGYKTPRGISTMAVSIMIVPKKMIEMMRCKGNPYATSVSRCNGNKHQSS